MERRFGWDCHGLPVVTICYPSVTGDFQSLAHKSPLIDFSHVLNDWQEYEIDKTLGIKGPEDVAKMGIAEYNKQCRGIVMRYSNEWEVKIQKQYYHNNFARILEIDLYL